MVIMGQQEFIHGLHNLEYKHQGCVATIGSFDGVHRGHMAIIRQVKAKAESLGLPSLVMVFEPQPHEFFAKETAPARLMRLREKICALFGAGIDRVLCLKFNDALRSLTASEYIEKVLLKGIGVKYLVIGDDFRFGCDRSGDFNMLCNSGRENGFEVCDTQTQLEDDERISSTRIRQLLYKNDLVGAARLLGKPFCLSGRVVYGKQLGRTLGFPTVNISLGRYHPPVAGVFAVEISRTEQAEKPWLGVANIGFRPTLEKKGKALLEVHILEKDLNLYGEFLTVSVKKHIREEKKFANIDELKQQIKSDKRAAELYFLDNSLN